MTIFGYTVASQRCASDDIDALRRSGCTRIVLDQTAGAAGRRELNRLLRRIGPGETLVVPALEVFPGSVSALLKIGAQLSERGAGLRSLAEPWADASAALATLLSGLADLDRRLLARRQDVARQHGVRVGRPPREIPDEVWAPLLQKLQSRELTLREAADIAKCDASTIHRRLTAHRSRLEITA